MALMKLNLYLPKHLKANIKFHESILANLAVFLNNHACTCINILPVNILNM